MPKPDAAHLQTDKKLTELEKRIARVYEEARADLNDEVTEYFSNFRKRDEEYHKLVDAGKITEEEYKQWRLNQIGRGKRFEALRDKMAERYTQANEVAVSYTNDATPGIYSLNRNYTAYTIEKTGADVDFTLFDEQTVKRLIVEEPNLMPYYPPKMALKRGIDLEYGKKCITKSVTSGILMGKSVGKIADDLQRDIYLRDRAGALRTARTAITGAQNAGRQDGFVAAEKMGIELVKEWIATLDNRTRHAHQILDGQEQPTDKPFKVDGEEIMFPGDTSAPGYLVYNCRCTVAAHPKNIDVSDAKRRARDPDTGKVEIVKNMTYTEWEKSKLSKEKPKKIKKESAVEEIMGVNIAPADILPVNNITDYEKFGALVYDFEHGGYAGRPIVAVDMGGGTYQALTGSHRIFAAREAGIDIPTVVIDYNDGVEKLIDVRDDIDRAEIAKKLYKNGKIEKDAYRLLSYENEKNDVVNEEAKSIMEKKAELYKLEKEAKEKAAKEAAEAAKIAKEKEAVERAKAAAESAEMAEYKSFLKEITDKYGEENMWSDMTDAEMSKLDNLERIAYKGR